MNLVKSVKNELQSDYLCLSGGVALNCVSNYHIQKSNLWVESHLIIKIEDTIMIQYMVGSNLHVKFLDIPQEFKQYLLSPCINTV